MRRLPTLMLGALTLTIGLLPTAAMAETLPTPTLTAEPSATPTEPVPSATVEPSATASPTKAPKPTATSTPDPSVPVDPPEEDYLFGTLALKPIHGKAGTTTTVTSKTNCVDVNGQVGPKVDLFVFTMDDLESDEAPFEKIISTDAKGAWSAKVKVPASAKTGDIYYFIAGCFAPGVEIDEDAEPFLIYDFAEFTVTEADRAPVADPVPGDPDFTG